MIIKKISVTAMAIAILIGGCVTNVTHAIEPQDKALLSIESGGIVPMWDNISSISPFITAKGRTLYPEVYIKSKKSTGFISGVMYLQSYGSGKWTTVASWRFSGTNNVLLSKTYAGTAGTMYRTKVIVTVDGEAAEATSGSLKI